jgi:two-component system nitrate/nitrite response regulator NarL
MLLRPARLCVAMVAKEGVGINAVIECNLARQIRKLVPESKIIFLSQESSAEVVQEAMGVGAAGYVIKVMAGCELLTAVGAVLIGKKFVSSR